MEYILLQMIDSQNHSKWLTRKTISIQDQRNPLEIE